jgi:fructose-bisphosphate aldolase class II
MNIDTDTQFAFTKPIRDYCVENEYRLARQIGTPEDPDQPNKKIIDPRVWTRLGEEGFRDRLIKAFEDLNSVGKALR